jgi:asparagine synthase (glutamine-hydrolysing)
VTSRIKLMLDPAMREGIAADAASERLRASLPEEFPRWTPLARAQYLEIVTLLSGYLLSSQGERMMMANRWRVASVPRPHGDDVADALPDARSSDARREIVLKRAMRDILPPRRAVAEEAALPGARVAPFFASRTPDYVDPVARRSNGRIWQPQPIAGLVAGRRTGGKSMSNSDDMAFCAALSTQLMARDLIAGARVLAAGDDTSGKLGVDVDRIRDGGAA